MAMKVSEDNNNVIFNHSWFFDTAILLSIVRRSALRLGLSAERYGILEVDKTELISVESRGTDFRRRYADALIKVALKGTDGEVTIRIMLEHKSQTNVSDMMTQLLRYQTAYYESDKTAIITIVINNGKPIGDGGTFRFRDHLEPNQGKFRELFDPLVMDFGVVIVNLQDEEIERSFMESSDPASFGWYVMSRCHQGIDESALKEIITRGAAIERAGFENLLIPALLYIRHYHSELVTIEKLKQMELEILEENKTMTRILDGMEALKHNAKIEGRQEGLQKGLQEGLQKGLQEGLQKGSEQRSHEIAQNMLQFGCDQKMISQVTKLSMEQIGKIDNGSGNSS